MSKGLDKRTTIMIRNIPNKYTQAMLLQEIDASYRGAYDFFYLPIDFKNKCNVGYAFINFIDYRRIVPFFREFNGQRWKNFNSEKVEIFFLPFFSFPSFPPQSPIFSYCFDVFFTFTFPLQCLFCTLHRASKPTVGNEVLCYSLL